MKAMRWFLIGSMVLTVAAASSVLVGQEARAQVVFCRKGNKIKVRPSTCTKKEVTIQMQCINNCEDPVPPTRDLRGRWNYTVEQYDHTGVYSTKTGVSVIADQIGGVFTGYLHNQGEEPSPFTGGVSYDMITLNGNTIILRGRVLDANTVVGLIVKHDHEEHWSTMRVISVRAE